MGEGSARRGVEGEDAEATALGLLDGGNGVGVGGVGGEEGCGEGDGGRGEEVRRG